jgi:hypothetical protein
MREVPYRDDVLCKVRGRLKIRRSDLMDEKTKIVAGVLLGAVWERLEAGETAEAVAADLGVPAKLVRGLLLG